MFRSIFTDKSTHPKKAMFSSSPHCTLSESQLSRKEILSYMKIPEKLILVYLYSRWKLALLYLVVFLMVFSWPYCWLCMSPLPTLQQFWFHILLMVYRSTWINYLVSLLFCSCSDDAQGYCWWWALLCLCFFPKKYTNLYLKHDIQIASNKILQL